METRARYILVGLFTLVVIAMGFGFFYWLHGAGGLVARTVYQIRFDGSVSGLLPGSAVLFNGIRVGEVTSLQLAPESPGIVLVTIGVERNTPVRADTRVGLDFQGLLGATSVSLKGGTATMPLAPAAPGQPPLLVADPTAGQDLNQAAREVLRRLDTILTENSEPLHNTLTNLDKFSDVLARNSDRLDGIIAGLERFVGGGPEKAPSYDLSAVRAFPAPTKEPRGQLVVADPTALIVLDTQKIVLRSKTGEYSTLAAAQWSDSLPKLLQAKIIESLENANYLRAVGRPMDGLTAEHQLQIEIRSFQISTVGEPVAEVALAAKIVSEDGQVVGGRVFRATVPATKTDGPAAVAALDEAFGKVATELVAWTAGLI